MKAKRHLEHCQQSLPIHRQSITTIKTNAVRPSPTRRCRASVCRFRSKSSSKVSIIHHHSDSISININSESIHIDVRIEIHCIPIRSVIFIEYPSASLWFCVLPFLACEYRINSLLAVFTWMQSGVVIGWLPPLRVQGYGCYICTINGLCICVESGVVPIECVHAVLPFLAGNRRVGARSAEARRFPCPTDPPRKKKAQHDS